MLPISCVRTQQSAASLSGAESDVRQVHARMVLPSLQLFGKCVGNVVQCNTQGVFAKRASQSTLHIANNSLPLNSTFSKIHAAVTPHRNPAIADKGEGSLSFSFFDHFSFYFFRFFQFFHFSIFSFFLFFMFYVFRFLFSFFVFVFCFRIFLLFFFFFFFIFFISLSPLLSSPL